MRFNTSSTPGFTHWSVYCGCVCVFVCVRACVRACMRACGCVSYTLNLPQCHLFFSTMSTLMRRGFPHCCAALDRRCWRLVSMLLVSIRTWWSGVRRPVLQYIHVHTYYTCSLSRWPSITLCTLYSLVAPWHHSSQDLFTAWIASLWLSGQCPPSLLHVGWGPVYVPPSIPLWFLRQWYMYNVCENVSLTLLSCF